MRVRVFGAGWKTCALVAVKLIVVSHRPFFVPGALYPLISPSLNPSLLPSLPPSVSASR